MGPAAAVGLDERDEPRRAHRLREVRDDESAPALASGRVGGHDRGRVVRDGVGPGRRHCVRSWCRRRHEVRGFDGVVAGPCLECSGAPRRRNTRRARLGAVVRECERVTRDRGGLDRVPRHRVARARCRRSQRRGCARPHPRRS